jgi:hypothetical protein
MLELNLRQRPVGGALLARVSTPPAVGFGHRRLILLLHGFNLSASAARNAYASFEHNFSETTPATRALLKDLVGILWPGDASWGLLSFASFPREIHPAVDSGTRLGASLGEVRGPGGGPVELFLVCHSLGNRVAMELLLSLAQHASAHVVVRGSCLMGAAVPVPMVGARLSRAAALARTQTLYSAADWVLHWAFPLGESLAREGWMPEAVGHLGHPASAWTESHAMVRTDGHGYRHSDYWNGKEVAGHVARLLGVALPQALARHAVLARSLPEAGSSNERRLPGRELAGARAFA